MVKAIYDSGKKQLICYRKNAKDSFWDYHWSDTDIPTLYKSLSKYNLITRITRKYLSPNDGPILEGGCGAGQFVYSISEAGYTCIGIDTAEGIIKRAQKTNPSLDLRVMDVRELKFPDNHLAAYWSLGVIEHFIEGYDKVLDEMSRVVQPGGYIFVTVPVMCLLRRLKAFFGLYETASAANKNDFSKADFYQFIFSPRKLINDFARKGLDLIEMRSKGGIKGLGDEVMILKAPLRSISQLRNKNILFKGFVKVFDVILSPLTGHMGLFVFNKIVTITTFHDETQIRLESSSSIPFPFASGVSSVR